MKIELLQPYSFCQIGKRSNQEDARFPDTDMPSPDAPCFVVCDGVGGQDKGEVASRTVCNAFGEYMCQLDRTGVFTVDDFGKALSFVYAKLLGEMKGKSREMATTMTFLCFHGEGVLAAHMGDSRIYHIRPQVGILYRSNDHSLVNAWVHSGNITPEAGICHPNSNYITRFLGYVENAELPTADVIQLGDIESGDYFFLCTDGVIQMLNEEKLQEILAKKESDEYKMKLIADICRESSDNNTACLIPVLQAVSIDDKEDIPFRNVNEGEEKNITLQLTKPHPVITEVRPLKDDSLKTRFIGFLKNLFK